MMRFLGNGLIITLTLIWGIGCASQSKETRSAGKPQPMNRPSATAPNQRAATTNEQILMDKIKADKKLLVAGNMDLTDAEAAQFWPLYEEYQRGLDQINQQLAGTIMEYAEASSKGAIPDQAAAKLLDEALTVEEAEIALKKSYAEKFDQVLPAAKTARYLQIETKIRSLLRLDLAEKIPLVH
jgi:hypothetical protein